MTQRYTKERLADCQAFRNQRDLISALLKDGQIYTMEEAKRLLNGFLKGKVKE